MTGTEDSAWDIKGNPSLVTTDIDSSFVGDLTQVLELKQGEAVSLVKDDQGLRKGMDYEGRIIIVDPHSIKIYRIAVN